MVSVCVCSQPKQESSGNDLMSEMAKLIVSERRSGDSQLHPTRGFAFTSILGYSVSGWQQGTHSTSKA